MRANRAGLGNLVAWLASGTRARAAWSLTLYEVSAGATRSGNAIRNAGVAAQGGKALATINDKSEWGGLDFLAADAFVAEEKVQDREYRLKDTKDDNTPGVLPWYAQGAEKNIREAKPLESVVLRTAAVGPGFENEHVAFPGRAQLIAHHRPDDPPINSTWVYDPGDGKPGDWRAGLHGPVRVRRWVDQFCAAAPNPRDTASSFEEPEDTFALLLNATRSGGDNSGWLGAHFAQAEAVLSAEAFGFAHPADDGFHDIARTADATIIEGGLEAFRTKFGSRGGLIYSPLAMSPDQWPFPGKQVIPVLTEIQEDYTDTHGKLCGVAPGYKKLVTWIPIFDWGPPVREPKDPPPPTDEPPVKPKYPGLIKVPFEGEAPEGPDIFGGGGPGGGYPASLSGDAFWDGRSLESLRGDYPAAGIVPPANFGERSAAVMGQLEGTSMQYRARPALPDGRLTLYARGGNEANDLAGLMYGYTLREALEAPVVADDVGSPNYLFASARNHDLPNERWPFVLSNEAELTENPVGGISGRVPARGPGSVMLMPSNAPVDWQYIENKGRWTGSPNEVTRIIAAGRNTAGLELAGRFGLGLRTLQSGRVASGQELRLGYDGAGGNDDPDLHLYPKTTTGGDGAQTGVARLVIHEDVHITGDLTVDGSSPGGGGGGALADPGGNGIVVRTSAGVTINRSIAVSGDALTVVNADGATGDPTLAAAADLENIVDTWAVDASGNVSGIGTLSSAATTETVADSVAGKSFGVDATKGPYEARYCRSLTTAGSGAAETLIDVPTVTDSSGEVFVQLECTRSTGDLPFSYRGGIAFNNDGDVLTLGTQYTLNSDDFGGDTTYAVSFVVSGRSVRVQITDNSVAVRCKAIVTRFHGDGQT